MNLTKSEFQLFINTLTASLERIDSVYPEMIESAKPFDRELAAKIEAAMKADRELLEYIKSKAESRQQLPTSVVVGFLGR